MLITPNHSSPQQHVGPVDEYNVELHQLNGATYIKQDQSTFLDSVKWFTEFGHLNRGDMLTSEHYRCLNEKKKFQRRV